MPFIWIPACLNPVVWCRRPLQPGGARPGPASLPESNPLLLPEGRAQHNAKILWQYVFCTGEQTEAEISGSFSKVHL